MVSGNPEKLPADGDTGPVVLRYVEPYRGIGLLLAAVGVLFVPVGIIALHAKGGGVSGLITVEIFALYSIAFGMNLVLAKVERDESAIRNRYSYRTRTIPLAEIESISITRLRRINGSQACIAVKLTASSKPILLRVTGDYRTKPRMNEMERRLALLRGDSSADSTV